MKLLLKKKDIWISRRSKHFWGSKWLKSILCQPGSFPEIGAPLSSIISLEVPYRFLVCGNYTAFSRWGATWFTSSVYYTAAGTLCKYLSENHMMNNTRSLSFRVAIFCHSGTISPWQIYHFSLNVLRYCIGVGTVNSFSQIRLWKNEVYADTPEMERLRSA